MTTVDTGIHHAERRDRVRSLLDRLQLDAAVLRTFPNFAWYTGGGDNRVDHSSPVGIAAIVVTRDTELVLTDTIEAERLAAEQVPDFQLEVYPWYEPLPLHHIVGPRVGVDSPRPGGTDISHEIAEMRRVLDSGAIEQYREVGADTTQALREVREMLTPGMTEWEMQAELEAACRRRGLYTPVAMAAADGRITRFRHPVTIGARAQHRVMLVVCAERGGLYANATTWVHFEEPDEEWLRREEACLTILRRTREELTEPGRTLAEVFAGIQALYADVGYPDEWRFHHQGGMTGYATREVVATPASEERVQIGQAYAWNPSIAGAKAEETFVLTPDGDEIVAAGT